MPMTVHPIMLPAVLLTIANEEERAFMTELYINHHRLMRFTARRYIREEADVEDVVSDAVVALHGKLATLRGLEERALRAYIVTAVRNTAINLSVSQRRRNDHAAPDGEEAMEQVSAGVDVEMQAELGDELSRVLAAMRGLSGKEQTVLRMRFAGGSTNEEIAEATGLSPESIRKYLSRARAHLRAAVYGTEVEC